VTLNPSVKLTLAFLMFFVVITLYSLSFGKVNNLEYGVLEPQNQHSQNFFLEWILISKMVISNLILNGITSKRITANRYIMLGTLVETLKSSQPI